ncbi:MAG: hypothetical protein ACLUER_12570 [Odoribacter splanchnicus]|jgi:hypothetical protein|uniref:hypothetical protein n=1 Tax=Odoribacter splanchnicus TaxID=28118 RepID=UPI00204703D1|nr:hypothetical protein [Odoribacter splanchnicus]DAP90096.1 MAG TPA: hypothetical protein [Caudoviricetes sp.]
MSKFDIYTFQFSPIIEDGTLSFEDIEAERKRIMENKNEFFEEVLTSATFVHRSKSLPLVVEYSDQDLKVIRIANIKTIEIERDFVKEWTENQPSCIVIIYNNAEVQRIAIEQKIEAFTDTKVVSSILNKTFNYKLRHYNLAIKINEEYNVQEFWNIASQYEKSIKKLRFEFNYPNLPRVTKNLNSALKNASEIVNSTRSAIEFNAEDEKTLQNINVNNKTINGLVKASAEGGTPIKMRVKGYKKYVETGNKAKTIEFDLDLSTENIEEVKDILRELKE